MIRSFHNRFRPFSRQVKQFTTYAWGNADFGQLGLPSELLQDELDTYGKRVPTPKQIPALHHYNIHSVSTSATHSAFIRADGTVFTCGDNQYGQLGHGDSSSKSIPTSVSNLPPIQSVACGSRHTLVLAEDGRLYSFGNNKYGQLGIGNDFVKSSNLPNHISVLLNDGIKVVNIAAGDDWSVAVCDQGNVYTWGRGDKGQLGHSIHASTSSLFSFSNASVEPFPRLIRSLQDTDIVSVYAGRFHLMLIDKSGMVYACGCGEHFLLGNGENKDIYEPVQTLHNLPSVVKLAPGATHCLILTKNGNVFAYGQNDMGCLGMGYENNERVAKIPIQVEGIDRAIDIAAGWHISAAVRKQFHDEKGNGQVVTWGSGDAGALGIADPVHHWMPVEIGLDARKVVIGCCSTSMMAIR